MRRLAILAVLFLLPGCVAHSQRSYYRDGPPSRAYYYSPPPPAYRGPPPRHWSDDRGEWRRENRHRYRH